MNKLILVVTFSIAAVNNKNINAYKLEYRQKGDTACISLLSGNSYSYNRNTLTEAFFGLDSAYENRRIDLTQNAERKHNNMHSFILKYWIEVIFGLILTGLSVSIKKLKGKINEQEEVKNGVVALLHDRLFQSCMFFINKGEISLMELDNINEMYKAYKALGGNGTGKEVVERANDLPIKK